jgi:hypothetical protein
MSLQGCNGKAFLSRRNRNGRGFNPAQEYLYNENRHMDSSGTQSLGLAPETTLCENNEGLHVIAVWRITDSKELYIFCVLSNIVLQLLIRGFE